MVVASVIIVVTSGTRRIFFFPCVGALFLYLCHSPMVAAKREASIEFFRIQGIREFPEATEPGAIQYACGPIGQLGPYFDERGLRLDQRLVRPRGAHPTCHIYYEPTIPGFQASTEDRPIRGFLANVHPQSFVLGLRPAGDSLSIVQRVFENLSEPRPIDIRINEHYDSSHWPVAIERHFRHLAPMVRTVSTPGLDTHPWAQDFVKSGAANGVLKILVPRRIFEGRGEDGEIHRPLLEGLRGDAYVRSKLSWEGGDLIFVNHPREPGRRIMVYGGAAKSYWGAELPPEDYEWILKTEFGADVGVGLLDAAAHVDFAVSFLPDRPTALVAQSVRENRAIAMSILDALERLWGEAAPAGLGLLRIAVSEAFLSLEADSFDAVTAIAAVREAGSRTLPPISPELAAALDNYVAERCSDSPLTCFDNVDANRAMLAHDPALARKAADLGLDTELYQRVPNQTAQPAGGSVARRSAVASPSARSDSTKIRTARVPRGAVPASVRGGSRFNLARSGLHEPAGCRSSVVCSYL